MVASIDARTFEQDEDLLADRWVVLAIKNFERKQVRERVLARREGRGAGLATSPPRDGAIARVRLDTSHLDDEAIRPGTFEVCKSPYQCIAVDGYHYFNAFDRVMKRSQGGISVYQDPLTKRVHSVDVDRRSGDLLISSSGFDVIHRLTPDMTLREVYSVWQAVPRVAVHGGRQHKLKEFDYAYDGDLPTYVVDPEKEEFAKGLGVGTSPFYLSGAAFALTGEVLYTGYNSRSLFVTDFVDTVEYDLDLVGPHSFLPLGSQWNEREYCVLDSGRGRVLFLDAGFTPVESLILTGLPKNEAEYGNEEWMQFLCVMEGCGARVLLIADQIRQAIHIVDIDRKKRRAISYPDTWSLHGIYVAP